MEHRYEKIVFEAEKGITFEIHQETKGVLNVKAMNLTPVDVYSHNYTNPPIPEGWKYLEGEWYNGYVIERKSDGSQFVWIPIGSLSADGILDVRGYSTEKFGRRNYQEEEFSENEYYEEMEEELASQLESIRKYGGFYISRYDISQSLIGKPQSVKGVKPWTRIGFDDAMKVAKYFEESTQVASHLTFGAEYDSVLAWFIKSKAKKLREVANDSTDWGNHWNTEGNPWAVAETGSQEEWCANSIYDFAGNVDEWTQEQHGKGKRVVRGGCCSVCGYNYPVAFRQPRNKDVESSCTGFRIALCIK